jgi:hypothetical protein
MVLIQSPIFCTVLAGINSTSDSTSDALSGMLQMQVATMAKGLVEHDSKIAPFSHGTAASLGSKDADPRVRAAAAWIASGATVLASKNKKDLKAGTACLSKLLSGMSGSLCCNIWIHDFETDDIQ